ASAFASTYAPPPENSLLAQTGDMAIFMDWYCKKQGITELKQKDLEGPAFEIFKVFHPNVIHLQYQIEECHKLLTDEVDDALIRPALSISKMKVAYYLDVVLEQMVPKQMCIKEECKYDIVAMYGISHWWFQRQRLYIDRDTSKGDRKVVRTHMRILSVVRIEVLSLYGVKDFKVNRMNSGLNTRFWTRKDVDKSKEFMFAIQKRLNARRIFHNLESFVGGRCKDAGIVGEWWWKSWGRCGKGEEVAGTWGESVAGLAGEVGSVQ
nr:hypothetical protein [Tanacetum cinerariifolium]